MTQDLYMLTTLSTHAISTKQTGQSCLPSTGDMNDFAAQYCDVLVLFCIGCTATRSSTAGDGKHHHFFSRFFAPWVGITEDPVTGSAHSVSGPYWAKRLDQQPTEMQARQSSPRGGELLVKVDWKNKRVVLGGQAVIISKGQLLLPQSLMDGGT